MGSYQRRPKESREIHSGGRGTLPQAIGKNRNLRHCHGGDDVLGAPVCRRGDHYDPDASWHPCHVRALPHFFGVSPGRRFQNRINWLDVLLSLLAVAVIVYMLVDFEDFIYRSVVPIFGTSFFGVILILLVLEATRRTSAGSCLG